MGSTSGAEDEDTEVRPTQVAPKHPGGRKPRNRLELINENKKLKRQIRNIRLQRSLWETVKRDGPATDIEKRSDAVLRLVDECGHLYEKSPKNRDQLSLEAGMHVNCLREAGLHFEKCHWRCVLLLLCFLASSMRRHITRYWAVRTRMMNTRRVAALTYHQGHWQPHAMDSTWSTHSV